MNLFWKSYAVLFFFISLGNMAFFYSPQSTGHLYYQMMMAFHKAYAIFFFCNTFYLWTTLLSTVIVFFYAFGITWGRSIAVGLFFLRAIAELTGHHYDLMTIRSSFSHEALYGWLNIAAIFFPLVPSYLAHWRYAFNLGTRT